MVQQFEVQDVRNLAVSPDGSRFNIRVRDVDGEDTSIVFPSEALKSLLMSLFRVADTAFRRQLDDESARLAYPVYDFELQAAKEEERLILTLKTRDGFDASFAVEPGMIVMMAAMARQHIDAERKQDQILH
ncbi:MAG: hypothetical protein AAF346_11215 [Pseudomonadota bacterium]